MEDQVSYVLVSIEKNNSLPLKGSRGHFSENTKCVQWQRGKKQHSLTREQKDGWGTCQRAAAGSAEKQARDMSSRVLHSRWGPLDFITINPHNDSEVQSILIIHRFYICKLSYSLKAICNPKSILAAFSLSFTHMHRAANMFVQVPS